MKYLTNSGLSYFFNKIKAYIASQLNSKASTIHTHTSSDITDLPSGLVVDSTLDGTSSNAIANSAVSNALDGKINKNDIYNLIYPVGSIYLSVNSVDPSTIFGGTWERIKDKFLLSSGDTYAVGTTGGSATTTLAIDNIPSHNHTGTTGNESQGHTHSGTTGNQSNDHTHTFSGTTSWLDNHTHSTWTDSQGWHQHNSGQGWYYTTPGSDRRCLSNYYLDGDGWSGNVTSGAGSHGHNVYMNGAGAHNHTYSGTTSGISANHTHDFTTGGISAHHTHSFTTSSVGSTEAFSNMPPYLTVNIWKRTA